MLMRWLGKSDEEIPLASGDDKESARARDPRWRRSHVFRMVIVKSVELRERLAVTLGAMAAETTCVSFFADAGLPQKHGFSGEATTRLVGYFIPSPRDDDNLEQQVRRLYRNARKAKRFSQIPDEMFHEVVEAMALPDQRGVWDPGVDALQDAIKLLAARIQGLGLSHELRVRGSFPHVSESPFFILPRCADRLLESLGENNDTTISRKAFHEAIVACHVETRAIARRLEATGISVAIVFALETIEKALRRMATIADVLTLPDGAPRSAVLHGLISECIAATFEDSSVKKLFASNLHLLAKKIVERTGHSGEHYIARTMKEYRWMWLAAAGGGILTVATASFKMRIVSAQLAPLQEGLLAGVNYSVSFIILVVCGLALATKQPAMTGAALGNILREHTGKDRHDCIIDAFMLICRSQFAAAISNVIFVTIGCVGLARLWAGLFSKPFLSVEAAEHVVTSLDPFNSSTIVFAAITGVVLWLASLVGGWIENWSIYNRLPQAMADHHTGVFVGVRRMKRIAEIYENNIASWASCIALGMMLGMVPEIGRISGLPLDVRHVTLSSGTLVLAVASLPAVHLSDHALFMAATGIGVTFALNLGVSFLLAFATAVRAYDVDRSELLRLCGRGTLRIFSRPYDFLLPTTWPQKMDLQQTELPASV
jgi:site-specific recombinase